MLYRTLAISLLLIVISSFAAIAQDEEVKVPDIPSVPTVSSPQVWSMIEYGNPSVSLNTGSPYLDVPLIEFSDRDFNLPISVSYSTPGFRPWVPDNYVGMGWRLNAGGVISRDIHGLPDDIIGITTAHASFVTPRSVSGILNGISGINISALKQALAARDTAYLHSIFENADFSRQEIAVGTVHKATNIEASSDTYHFIMDGKSGKFMIDFDGSIVIQTYDGGRYEVDLSDYTPRSACSVNPSTIHIYDDRGYKYSFGGNYSTQDYTAFSFSDFAKSSDYYYGFLAAMPFHFNRTTAYHLSRITAPNGRELEIDYYDEIPDSLHQSPYDIVLSAGTMTPYLDTYGKYFQVAPSYDLSEGGTDSQMTIQYTVIKQALIKEIRTDDKRVVFHFSRKDNPFFSRTNQQNISEYGFIRGCGAALDSVVLFSRISTKKIEKTTLGYSTINGRLLLSELTSSRRGRHSLNYYPSTCGFNSSLTINIDKWGFWNGKDTNNSLTQQYSPYGGYDSVSMLFNRLPGDKNREPSALDYTAFMLKSVEYPTGGSTEFNYEPHDYSEYYSQEYLDNYIGHITGQLSRKKLAGGARVSTEIHSSGASDREPRIRMFNYDNGDSYRSEGTLLTEGEYYIRACRMPLRPNPYAGPYVSTNTALIGHPSWGYSHNRSNGLGGYITYGRVTEYDFLSRESVEGRDSVFSFSLHPVPGQNDIIQDWFSIRVGAGEIYGDDELWTISGGNSSITVRNSYGTTVYTLALTEALGNRYIHPFQSFGEGSYTIAYTINGDGWLNFRAIYPRARQIVAPRKVTRFSTTPAGHNTGVIMFNEPALGKGTALWALNNDPAFIKHYYSIPKDYSQEGGKVLSEEWFSTNGELIKSKEYTYAPQRGADMYYFYNYPAAKGFLPTNLFANIVEVPMFRMVTTETKETLYNTAGANFVTKTIGEYDRDGYLSSSYIAVPSRDTLAKHFIRPEALNTGEADSLKRKKMYAIILEETWATGDTNTVFREKTDFKPFGPDSLLLASVISSSYSSEAPEPRITYNSYDCYGNPTSITADGKTTILLWGYKGKHIVASIENSSLPAVLSAVGLQDASVLSALPTPDSYNLDSLRALLPDAMVSTYKYEPEVGLILQTHPDGRCESYNYDSAGRMASKSIREADGSSSLVNAFEYNLVNQQ